MTKDIGNHIIYSDGRIWSKKYKRFITSHPCKTTGYIMTSMTRYKHQSVHRIIAETFIPNPENKPWINHKNGIKTDNRVENLEWCTASENISHAFKIGLLKDQKGEKNNNCKLSEKDVILIRESRSEGFKNWQLAFIFDVRESYISQIKNKNIWI